MSFASVAWANNDVITKAKLDQMVANGVHVQAEVESVVVYRGSEEITGTGYTDDGAMSIRIDGVSIIDYTTEGAKFSGNVSLSGVPAGLVELDFYADGESSTNVKFIKTANMVYMTIWLSYSVNFDGDISISGVTIICHKDSQLWTI